MTAVAELVTLVAAWRLTYPTEYAVARERHNRWQAAHATRLAMREWLEDRRCHSR